MPRKKLLTSILFLSSADVLLNAALSDVLNNKDIILRRTAMIINSRTADIKLSMNPSIRTASIAQMNIIWFRKDIIRI
ncbi:MAG: hypothetical protein QGI94_06680 [Candidatus Scalindua sp.]|nr:hypothetical protein [Candidatus Scalindua sp.]